MMGDDAEVVEVRKGTKMVEMDRRERIVVWLCIGVCVCMCMVCDEARSAVDVRSCSLVVLHAGPWSPPPTPVLRSCCDWL